MNDPEVLLGYPLPAVKTPKWLPYLLCLMHIHLPFASKLPLEEVVPQMSQSGYHCLIKPYDSYQQVHSAHSISAGSDTQKW